MEFTKTVDSLHPNDPPHTIYKKLVRMSLGQIEEEARKFTRYAELSQIINCYLMIKKLPDMNMELIFDEEGWHLRNGIKIKLNFETSPQDVEIVKDVKVEKD